MSKVAERDIELWKQWSQNRNVDNTRALLNQTQGVRYRAVNNWTGSVSPTTLNSEAIKISMKAFESFDPNKGVQLSTHLTNNLKKLSRLGYSEVSFLRMPEERQMKYTAFETAKDDMKERLGRDPSEMELADELGWPAAEVARFLKEDRKILISSEPLPVGMESFTPQAGVDPNDRTHYAVADMNPVDQQIFKHTTGYGGAQILDGKSLMKKLNLKQSQLSYRKQVITRELKKFGR